MIAEEVIFHRHLGSAAFLSPSLRFWDCLPCEARKDGRVLLFCETGMSLYRSDGDGEPAEVTGYGPFPGNEKRYLTEDTIAKLVKAARAGLKAWFSDLRDDPSLLAEGHWLHGLAVRWSQEDAPLSHGR